MSSSLGLNFFRREHGFASEHQACVFAVQNKLFRAFYINEFLGHSEELLGGQRNTTVSAPESEILWQELDARAATLETDTLGRGHARTQGGQHRPRALHGLGNSARRSTGAHLKLPLTGRLHEGSREGGRPLRALENKPFLSLRNAHTDGRFRDGPTTRESVAPTPTLWTNAPWL